MATLLPGPFTVEMYHKLGELGVFSEDDRVELLDGQIVEMSPIGRAHAACVTRLNHLLSRRSSADIAVSVQNPIALAQRWEPQPDIVVVRRPGGFAGAWHPTPQDSLLVIEVAMVIGGLLWIWGTRYLERDTLLAHLRLPETDPDLTGISLPPDAGPHFRPGASGDQITGKEPPGASPLAPGEPPNRDS